MPTLTPARTFSKQTWRRRGALSLRTKTPRWLDIGCPYRPNTMSKTQGRSGLTSQPPSGGSPRRWNAYRIRTVSTLGVRRSRRRCKSTSRLNVFIARNPCRERQTKIFCGTPWYSTASATSRRIVCLEKCATAPRSRRWAPCKYCAGAQSFALPAARRGRAQRTARMKQPEQCGLEPGGNAATGNRKY